MSCRRQIAWSVAMRDLQNARAPRPAINILAARSLARAKAGDALRLAQARSLSSADGYDRSAIMSLGIALAWIERAKGSREPWRTLMRSALKFAWSRAQVTRAAAAH